MIEGQEGVTWPQWVALARAAEDAQLDALFRSDHYRSISRGDPNGALDAWGDDLRARGCDEHAPPRHARHAGHVSQAVGAREARHDRRPHLRRPRRARARRRLVRVGARRVRIRLHDVAPAASTSSTASSPRSRASGRRPTTSGRSRVQQPRPRDHRRRPRQAAHGRAPPSRYADEYNTVWPTVAEARERKQRLDDAAAPGRTRASALLDDDRAEGRRGRARGAASRAYADVGVERVCCSTSSTRTSSEWPSWATSRRVYASRVRLFLVRHAEAAPGEPDELRRLTAAGRDAARALGEQLAPQHPTAVVSSPLLRARETAEPDRARAASSTRRPTSGSRPARPPRRSARRPPTRARPSSPSGTNRTAARSSSR